MTYFKFKKQSNFFIKSFFSEDSIEKKTLILMSLFALIFTWLCFFGQKISINNGAGWDGVEYLRAVKIFPHYLHAFDQYRAHRVLPSFIVAFGLRMLGFDYSDINIIHGFEVLNYTAVMFSVILWWFFVVKFKVNLGWRLVSFSGLFLNYPILSLTGYNPVITDTVAFACGISVFYFYLLKKPLFVFLFGIIGCFTFPTFSLYTFLLLLFPYNNKEKKDSDNLNENVFFTKLVMGFSATITLMAAGFVAVLIAPTSFIWPSLTKFSPSILVASLNCFSDHMSIVRLHFVPSMNFLANLTYFSYPLLTMSVLALFIYLYYGLKSFNLFFIPIYKKNLNEISLKTVALSLLLLLVNFLILSLMSNDEIGALTPLLLFRGIAAEVLSLPMINLVASFVYYGPFVFFIILFWSRLCTNVTEVNLGCALSLAFMIILSLTSESRKLIEFLGMIVFLVLLLVPDTKLNDLPKAFSLFFVGLSLAFSKCWFHITIPSKEAAYSSDYLLNSWQDYFMNFGIWMSASSYVIQLGAIILSLCLIQLFLLIKK